MATRKKSRTRTSAFGSAGRVNHDASAFYNGAMYNGAPVDKDVQYVETNLPNSLRNRIFTHSSEDMHQLPDNSVHLMVTSPPYNVGKEYDQNLTLKDYREFLHNVWSEVRRVLVPGGRACINIANLGRKPYIPLHAYVIDDMLSLGFLMRGEIIWNKAASASISTAWGSWLSASNPTLRDVHEYILVFSKDSFRRKPPEKRLNTIEKEDFLDGTKSVWTIPAASAKKIGHPAPFPEELPTRLIELYTFEREIVLDPFMGSGQTALAAINSGRDYLGYEIEEAYTKLAQERIETAKISE